VTEIDFGDGDEPQTRRRRIYEKSLSETLQNAAQNPLRNGGRSTASTHVETRAAENAEVKRTHRAKAIRYVTRMTTRAKPGPLSERPI
jgi:hypothetical protein